MVQWESERDGTMASGEGSALGSGHCINHGGHVVLRSPGGICELPLDYQLRTAISILHHTYDIIDTALCTAGMRDVGFWRPGGWQAQ
jgi:hypothetical protein